MGNVLPVGVFPHRNLHDDLRAAHARALDAVTRGDDEAAQREAHAMRAVLDAFITEHDGLQRSLRRVDAPPAPTPPSD